jgi:hypothetical protein
MLFLVSALSRRKGFEGFLCFDTRKEKQKNEEKSSRQLFSLRHCVPFYLVNKCQK